MKQAELIKRVLAGEILALGEYRHSKKEMLEWRDKQTGKALSAPILRHTVEFGDVSVAVSERVKDGTKLEDVNWPWVKSQRVVLRVQEIESKLGMVSARGVLEAFESEPVADNGNGGSHTSAPSPGRQAQPVGGVAGSRSQG